MGDDQVILDISGVSKIYDRKWCALRDVSFQVSRGEFVLLVGPCGAGKTTLIRLITREELPSGGTIQVVGDDVGSLDRRDVPPAEPRGQLDEQRIVLLGRVVAAVGRLVEREPGGPRRSPDLESVPEGMRARLHLSDHRLPHVVVRVVAPGDLGVRLPAIGKATARAQGEEIDGQPCHRLDYEAVPDSGGGMEQRVLEATERSVWLETEGLHVLRLESRIVRPVSTTSTTRSARPTRGASSMEPVRGMISTDRPRCRK